MSSAHFEELVNERLEKGLIIKSPHDGVQVYLLSLLVSEAISLQFCAEAHEEEGDYCPDLSHDLVSLVFSAHTLDREQKFVQVNIPRRIKVLDQSLQVIQNT